MPRIKKKKEPVNQTKKPSNTPFIVILVLLLVQTSFLFYKNYDYIKEVLRGDPNLIIDEYQKENSGSDLDGELTGTDAGNIRVSVLNGCGVSGLASKWKDKLRKLKFDVRETGNAQRKYEKTIILSRTENMSYARYMAEILGVEEENVIMQLNKDLVDIDLTIIVGSDYKKFDK